MKLLAVLAAHRYGELEKAIERETDPVRKAELERELLRAMRAGR